MTALLDTPPAVLAPALDAAARRYIAARTRSGDALLEAVAALADARQAAQHGQWSIFLAAVGLDDSRARALIRLHDACLTDRALADRVRSGWLSEAAARELLPAPPDVRAAVLDAADPPTLADVREAKRGDETPHDLRRAGVQLVRHGAWYQPVGFSGDMNGWVGDAAPRQDAIRAAWAEIKRRLDTPNRAATPALLPTPPVAAPALPPLPDPLCYTWTRWQNEDGVIGMCHVSGYKISGTDAGDVEDVARHLSRPLAELHDHAWRVSYDASADGRADLHAYTATHEEFDAISAPSIQRLALAAWWARQAEDDVPNMPDDVIDALWLAGYDWTGTAWVRGFERIDEDANLKELRYQLGLTQDAPISAVATPTPHLPADWADAQRRATRLGLYLGMNMAGVFRLSNLNNSIDHQIEAWADVLKLLDRKEAAAAVATVRGVGGSIPRIDAGALGTLGTRLTETSDPRELATLYRAIGMLLAAGGVLPALPTRPHAPRSADVSDQLAYLGRLETYVAALEARAGVRE